MISRRNIRVKVMQTLYAIDNSEPAVKLADPVTTLTKKIERTKQLYFYLIYFITEVARYSEKDAAQKANKHLPTANDLAVNTRIAGNELLWKIVEDPTFVEVRKELRPENLIDGDLVKRTYMRLAESDVYKEYIEQPSRDKKSEKRILEFIFTDLMLPEDNFISHIEENFINWDDDAEMMQTLVLNYLSKPSHTNFKDILSAEKWDFASSLVTTVIDKSEYLIELIKPKLKNWDADRIAALDLIILQMGVCEFLYFETIPTKVTINEYIDLAKSYSTVQSGQFVNGLLDNIHKELSAENKIHKKNYKNSVL